MYSLTRRYCLFFGIGSCASLMVLLSKLHFLAMLLRNRSRPACDAAVPPLETVPCAMAMR